MIAELPPCPQPPNWAVDWASIDALPWLQSLRGCPQDPEHHAEGDAWTHTHLVAESMVTSDSWRQLPADERSILFAAALFHDIGKPDCTRLDDTGKITSRGHSRRGAILARQLLWRGQVPFASREAIVGLVRMHMRPFFLIDAENPSREAILTSLSCRCDHLAILAEADARGRQSHSIGRLLDQVALFRAVADENDCLIHPYVFPDEHTRFVYARDFGRQPNVPVYPDHRSHVLMLAGLPGSGKDHWLARHHPELPVVSLDALRDELDIAPNQPQGAVVQAAREQAKTYLRAGQSFAWNATNLSRQLRGECIRLLAQYHASIQIVYIETTPGRLFEQNRQRKSVLPEKAILRLLDRWEVPTVEEAQSVIWEVQVETMK